MSDELDPTLSRLFAQANQSLPGAEFQARVAAELRRAPGWFDIAQGLRRASRAALGGIVTGVCAPFKLRPGYVGAMVASAALLTLWVTV